MSKNSGESKKTEHKKKEKVLQDLTFGLKNKNKSKVVQKYVKEVTDKVMYSNVKVSESTR
jgi:1,2-phenylacetyl-CoA epoxidase catalytic subunit